MGKSLNQKNGLKFALAVYDTEDTPDSKRTYSKNEMPKGFIEIEKLDERFPKPSQAILDLKEKYTPSGNTSFSKVEQAFLKQKNEFDYNNQRNENGEIQRCFQVYVNPESKQIYFAFRGSDVSANYIGSVKNAGGYEFQKIAPYAQWVLDQIKSKPEYKDYQITTTGHSMGGAFAQAFGVRNGLDIQVYNSLPIPNFVIKDNNFMDGKNYFAGHQGFDNAVDKWKK